MADGSKLEGWAVLLAAAGLTLAAVGLLWQLTRDGAPEPAPAAGAAAPGVSATSGGVAIQGDGATVIRGDGNTVGN